MDFWFGGGGGGFGGEICFFIRDRMQNAAKVSIHVMMDRKGVISFEKEGGWEEKESEAILLLISCFWLLRVTV